MDLGFYKQNKIENCKHKEKWKFFSFHQFYYKKLGNENVLNISLNSITMWCEPRSLLPLIMSCYIKFVWGWVPGLGPNPHCILCDLVPILGPLVSTQTSQGPI